jgi:hypothetical protein
MKKYLLFPVVALIVLGLSGCGTNLGKFADGVGSAVKLATTSVANPVTTTNIYQVKVGYKAALGIVADYRRYCYARPYAALMADSISKPICENRRQYIRTAQAAKAKAKSAIAKADTFIKENPTLNASTVVTLAWDAVKDFQLSVPTVR